MEKANGAIQNWPENNSFAFQLCVEKLSQNVSDSPWIQKKETKKDIRIVKMPQNLI